MNNHFATRNLNPDGSWKDLTKQKNSAADNSPTASQMIVLWVWRWHRKNTENYMTLLEKIILV